MKRKQNKHRKLRKCEKGIKTKSFYKGHRSVIINGQLKPRPSWWYGDDGFLTI